MNKKKQNLSLGITALKAGDYETAKQALTLAAKNSRDAGVHANLGAALTQTGDISEAAAAFTEALKIKPNLEQAARRLSTLQLNSHIAKPETLNPFGLRAALKFNSFEKQPIVDLAIAHCLAQKEWLAVLEQTTTNPQDAAENLIGNRTSPLLKNDLLLAALSLGKNTDPLFERLLAALRRHILLNTDTDRMLNDKAFLPLLITLMSQCHQNEYVWPVSENERKIVADTPLDIPNLLSGTLEASFSLIKKLLYLPLQTSEFKELNLDNASKLKPKALQIKLKSLLEAQAREDNIKLQIKSYQITSDEISSKVRQQYEESPYPRWTSLHISKPGSLRKALENFYGAEKLNFMDNPFDVLIAGCGTGQQAARSASGYGENASVLGVDLSLASLAYGKSKCEEFGLTNIDFAQADILALSDMDKSFDIIECVGVLHHMADPFHGWRVLIDKLKPGGLMYIGLYSDFSRKNITALRNESENPGPDCSDEDARAYRNILMNRKEGELGYSLRTSADFFALNEFRDLVLHQSEKPLTLEQIDGFISQTDLELRGLVLPPNADDAYAHMFNEQPTPGTLANWHKLETENTSLFDGMYLLWFERKS